MAVAGAEGSGFGGLRGAAVRAGTRWAGRGGRVWARVPERSSVWSSWGGVQRSSGATGLNRVGAGVGQRDWSNTLTPEFSCLPTELLKRAGYAGPGHRLLSMRGGIWGYTRLRRHVAPGVLWIRTEERPESASQCPEQGSQVEKWP